MFQRINNLEEIKNVVNDEMFQEIQYAYEQCDCPKVWKTARQYENMETTVIVIKEKAPSPLICIYKASKLKGNESWIMLDSFSTTERELQDILQL